MMLERISTFFRSFRGAMCMAIFSFLCLLNDIHQGSEVMAWFMGICTVMWLYFARRALKDGGVTIEADAELTFDQRKRIRDATQVYADVLKEIDEEIAEAKAQAVAEALIKAKEKADGKADKRSDSDDSSG
jgi:hypothetical protein